MSVLVWTWRQICADSRTPSEAKLLPTDMVKLRCCGYSRCNAVKNDIIITAVEVQDIVSFLTHLGLPEPSAAYDMKKLVKLLFFP